MIKAIIVTVVAIAGLVGALLVYASTRPDSFSVQRTATIKAPPEKVFPLISDYRQWPAWSPWEHKDPAMKRTLSGPPSGKGAVYEWEGNSEVGKGRMEITDAAAPSKIAIRLDFMKPFEAHNKVDFTLRQSGDGTTVVWDMFCPAPLVSKVMGIFVDMDKMIGKDFEAGLAKLKTVAEM